MRNKYPHAKYSEIRSSWDDYLHWSKKWSATEISRLNKTQQNKYLNRIRKLSTCNDAQTVAECA